MFNSKKIIPALSLLFLLGCGSSPNLGDFDSKLWKSDVKGCSGQRVSQAKEIDEIKSELLGLHHKKIVKILGPPEEQELYKRSQNYYSYFVDPGTDCDSSTQNPRKLVIRFTALGIANEVNIR